ncbi:MAG: MCE family protein [Nocardioidaceae bacterium]
MATPALSTSLGRRVLGCAFLALLVLAVYLTYAVFSKKFVDVAWVQLETSKIGLQMESNADVKIRGVRVGEVREFESKGDGAVVTMAIEPDQLDTIPANVTGLILPKTLFGEKYISLEVPDQPSNESLRTGDTIERTENSIEVEEVLSDLYPLLRTVEPAKLSSTLNAMSTALEGRGDDLGDGLTRLDAYLKEVNPLIPQAVEDLELLTTVSDDYAEVMPDLGRLLENSLQTGETLRVKERALKDFFTDVTGLSSTTRDFLEQNGDNIIRLGEVSSPTLDLLAEYSPEYPCLLGGLADYAPRGAETFRGYTLHVNLETVPRQPTGYTPEDDPKYNAKYGPYCGTLPDSPYNQQKIAPMPPFATDVENDDGVADTHNKYRQAPIFDLTSGYAGTEAEQRVVDALAAPVLGVPTDEVPDIATFLLGPIARGGEVSLR